MPWVKHEFFHSAYQSIQLHLKSFKKNKHTHFTRMLHISVFYCISLHHTHIHIYIYSSSCLLMYLRRLKCIHAFNVSYPRPLNAYVLLLPSAIKEWLDINGNGEVSRDELRSWHHRFLSVLFSFIMESRNLVTRWL